jgi:hypothetical protein
VFGLLLVVPVIYLNFILSSLLVISLSEPRYIVLAPDLFFRSASSSFPRHIWPPSLTYPAKPRHIRPEAGHTQPSCFNVFHPHRTMYLIRNSFANTQNACFILVVVLVLHPPPCSDLRTKSDLTVHASDVVENIIGYTVIVVLEDDQHVGRLEGSFCSCEECRTTRSGCANVGYSLDEEGLSVVRTLQPVNGFEVFIGIPIRELVVMFEVEAIGDDVA